MRCPSRPLIRRVSCVRYEIFGSCSVQLSDVMRTGSRTPIRTRQTIKYYDTYRTYECSAVQYGRKAHQFFTYQPRTSNIKIIDQMIPTIPDICNEIATSRGISKSISVAICLLHVTPSKQIIPWEISLSTSFTFNRKKNDFKQRRVLPPKYGCRDCWSNCCW